MKKYFILAAVAATFAACSFDKDMGESSQTTQEEKIPLNIGIASGNTNAITVTRAVYTNLQRDTLNKNTALGLYIIKQGITSGTNNTSTISSTPESYEIINYKLGGTVTAFSESATKYGFFSSITKEDGSTSVDHLYYPDNKLMQIGLFAYAPHTTITGTDGSTHITSFTSTPVAGTDLGTQTLTVKPLADQTKEADYVRSDVLWGVQGYGTMNNDITAANHKAVVGGTGKNGFLTGTGSNASYTGKIILPMYHALAKVTVNLFPSGMELSKLKGATVKIYVNYDEGTMKLTDGTVNKGTILGSATAITLTTHLGLTQGGGSTEITEGEDGHPTNISYGSNTYKGYSCSAVIIPQTVYESAGTDQKFIEIILTDGTTYAFSGKDINLSTARQEYIYNIQVTASGLNVVTTVADWTSTGSATESDATLTD